MSSLKTKTLKFINITRHSYLTAFRPLDYYLLYIFLVELLITLQKFPPFSVKAQRAKALKRFKLLLL